MAGNTTQGVLIAHGHPMCRNGLRAIAVDDLGLEVVACADAMGVVVDCLRNKADVSALIIARDLPGLGGDAGLRGIRLEWPSLRTLVICSLLDRDMALSALSAGAHGCVSMEATSEELAAAFTRVLSGQTYVPEVISGPPTRRKADGEGRSKFDSLSPRQRDVIAGVIAGKSCKQIARDLEIAEGTVKIHTHAAYRALGVRNRVEALVALRDVG
ncbi:DNA-binding NarL/FixJ family response regulator [Brevundimonas lenta]|uniref:DNA-binding NarL/FixJ family response regulator n=2 Tax=Brevundimonas lenta TaxID=424796 RepID=A0A7W6NQC6_9CAUL|nr:response regulator transcription factor [Brevundimonas lenta]MBB4083449.1 DNA-binding NarL/FixJ family response regulator [Brevundimonas lenta]